jgi:hypothetical protein
LQKNINNLLVSDVPCASRTGSSRSNSQPDSHVNLPVKNKNISQNEDFITAKLNIQDNGPIIGK